MVVPKFSFISVVAKTPSIVIGASLTSKYELPTGTIFTLAVVVRRFGAVIS